MALLDNLLTLHRVDSQVRALRSRVTSAETYFRAQEKQLALLAKQKAELETQFKQLQASVHGLEVEQGSATARVEKLRGELNTSTNDKQYKAILNEMKSLETQRDEVVKRAVEEMQRAEETKKRLELHESTIAERLKIRDVAKNQFDECMKDVGERLSELEAERARAAELVPDRERKLFDKVADETEGEAMAEITVVSMRHREFACGACNIEVPFETYARLSSSSNDAVQCRACTRILFLSDANRPVDPKDSKTKDGKAKDGKAKATLTTEAQEKAALARDKAKFEKTKKL
jgi:predicted  nucleic acid-binding Zn-ribbon protein